MKKRRQGGFTLVELAMVMGISVMVAGALIGLFQAHIQMLNQAVKYNFLAQDAPFIGLLLTRTIGNAEDYRVYASGTTARTSTGTPVLTGPAVKLWMRQPNSTFRQVVVSFETPTSGPFSGHQGIYVFLTPFSATPNWELAGGQLTGATFDATSGVLLATLTGSYNDQYIFSAEKK
jgi:hypothetical protein